VLACYWHQLGLRHAELSGCTHLSASLIIDITTGKQPSLADHRQRACDTERFYSATYYVLSKLELLSNFTMPAHNLQKRKPTKKANGRGQQRRARDYSEYLEDALDQEGGERDAIADRRTIDRSAVSTHTWIAVTLA